MGLELSLRRAGNRSRGVGAENGPPSEKGGAEIWARRCSLRRSQA
jgi:hypothetical protein